jgi:hypothetical protein
MLVQPKFWTAIYQTFRLREGCFPLLFKAVLSIVRINSDFFLIKSVSRSAFVVTDYLFGYGHKSLTAEYTLRLQTKSIISKNGRSSVGKLFVPSLVVAFVSAHIIESLTGLFFCFL